MSTTPCKCGNFGLIRFGTTDYCWTCGVPRRGPKGWIDLQMASVRREALEEAAKLVESWDYDVAPTDSIVGQIASEIRALIDKPGEG